MTDLRDLSYLYIFDVSV